MRLPAEFKQEPRQSLVSGKDGLDVIRKLLSQAKKLLNPEGVLVIEVGGLRRAMEKAWPKMSMTWLSTNDGLDCVVLIRAADLISPTKPSPRARRR